MWIAWDKSVIGAKELLGRCVLLSCSMASMSWEVQCVIVSVGVSCGLVASSDRNSDGIPIFSEFPKISFGTPFRSELGIVRPSVLFSEKLPTV